MYTEAHAPGLLNNILAIATWMLVACSLSPCKACLQLQMRNSRDWYVFATANGVSGDGGPFVWDLGHDLHAACSVCSKHAVRSGIFSVHIGPETLVPLAG